MPRHDAGRPATLIVIGANVAALNFAVLSFHTLRLNRALLPEALRPPLWREAIVAVGGLGFAALALLAAAARLGLLVAPGRLSLRSSDHPAVHQHELEIGERLDALGRIPRHREEIGRVARGDAAGHLAQPQALGRHDVAERIASSGVMPYLTISSSSGSSCRGS